MRTIVIFCSDNDAGKTETIKNFFKAPFKTLESIQFFKKSISKILCYGFIFNSSNKLGTSMSPDIIKAQIEELVRICDIDSKGNSYVLLIPFNIFLKKNNLKEINLKSIIEPIIYLRAKGSRVITIYLRTENKELLNQNNKVMKKISQYQIESFNNSKKQAKALEKIIRRALME